MEKLAWISDLMVRADVPLNRYVFQMAFSFGLPNANVFFPPEGFRLVATDKSSPVLFLVGIFRVNLSAGECDPIALLSFIDGRMRSDDSNQGLP